MGADPLDRWRQSHGQISERYGHFVFLVNDQAESHEVPTGDVRALYEQMAAELAASGANFNDMQYRRFTPEAMFPTNHRASDWRKPGTGDEFGSSPKPARPDRS
jgi:hypothetical protein